MSLKGVTDIDPRVFDGRPTTLLNAKTFAYNDDMFIAFEYYFLP